MNKSKGKAGGGDGKSREKKMQASANENIMTLRAAIYNNEGEDRDVLAPFASLAKFDRDGLKAELSFAAKLPRRLLDAAVAINKENMTGVYDAAGYEWSEEDIRAELREQSNRFIVAREPPAEADGPLGKLLGYMQFRFSFQGEFLNEMSGKPSLFIWDLQVLPEVQRKGLGRHFLILAELIARTTKMQFVQVLCPDEADAGVEFLTQKLVGFQEDNMAYSLNATEDDFYTIYQKAMPLPKPAAAPAAPSASNAAEVATPPPIKEEAPSSATSATTKGAPDAKSAPPKTPLGENMSNATH